MRKIVFGVALTAALWLASAASAFAWPHFSECKVFPPTMAEHAANVVAYGTWGSDFTDGWDTALEVVQISTPTIVPGTTFVTVARKEGDATGPPRQVVYNVPLADRSGKPFLTYRYYIAKSSYADEHTESKSKVCQVPPTQVDCKGNMYPPGAPVPPPSVLCPPPPVPPVTVEQPPPPPPAPCLPESMAGKKIVTHTTKRHIRFRVRGHAGPVAWFVDNKFRRFSERIRVAKRLLYGKHRVMARVDQGCDVHKDLLRTVKVPRPPKKAPPPIAFTGSVNR